MEKEIGFIKKTIILYVETSVGDNWQDKEYCDFKELKNHEGYVVEKKLKEEK